MADAPVIVWFRNDLRLTDHPALAAAVEQDTPILPLYIFDTQTPDRFALGGASRWWLHGSLASLDAELRGQGGALCLRRGRAPEVIADLLARSGPKAIHVTRGSEPWEAKLLEEVTECCRAAGAELRSFEGRLLFEPDEINSSAGEPYRIFAPFWRACLGARAPRTPLAAPRHLRFVDAPQGDSLEDWRLRPTAPDWAGGLRETWTPGEPAAKRKLEEFVKNGLSRYAAQRDRLDRETPSRLSPHLHFGEISPNQVWHAVRSAASRAGGKTDQGADAFLRELGWRDFSYHLLLRVPSMLSEPLKPNFARFAWRKDETALAAWRKGKTGYPVVDAAMRELWHIGYMPNRGRLIVASFLVKHLLLPWQEGADWFLDTLVDADLANNAANWQWVAGSGTDAAPYFRIFNPVLQGEKFDPRGDYVRRWVPELADLAPSHIHAPWKAPKLVLAEAGVELGRSYPLPIVEHGKARARALAAFEAVRSR